MADQEEDAVAAYIARNNLQADPRDFPGDLSGSERRWVALQPWLLERGYQLRPRYREGWVPKWKGRDNYAIRKYEDAQTLPRTQLCDATRLSDGLQVMLKREEKSILKLEAKIGQYFSSQDLRADSRNHCTPVLDVLDAPDDESHQIIVAPLLRPYDDPPFETIGEVLDFVGQILEGLQFMHEHHVAHRDANSNNIMMDATTMFPEGYHPVVRTKTPSFAGSAPHFSRTERLPKYYFIDFGHARQYTLDQLPVQEPILLGGDKSPPEHQQPHSTADPFPTDVYFLGNLIRKDFLMRKRGFAFLEPLISEMVQEDPTKRPTAEQVVQHFNTLRTSLSGLKVRSRVIDQREFFITGLFRGPSHWARQALNLIRQRPPLGRVTHRPDSSNWAAHTNATSAPSDVTRKTVT